MRQALYRLYRPRHFDEVVGQEHITTVLKNEMRQGMPSHAYLFIGSRGTGKTTCAKLVAKAVNCLSLRDGNPCGECDICRGVDDGSLLDVVEIDAASNNGVDNIRDLRDEAVFTPAVAKYRVYIIDEVHMLSTSAFNALLKILEEPPEHVIFILATTEIHKVLPTIISRCQRFDFQRIESVVIAERLQEVARRESLTIADEAAGLIARLSDGGMRDALSLLDVCAADTDDVTLDTVVKAAGLTGSAHLLALTDSVLSGDTAGMLAKLAELRQKSMEPQRLCEQLCGHYRNLMLVKTLEKPEAMLDCLPSEIPNLRRQVQKITLTDLLHSLSVLQETAARIAKSPMKHAELELALVTLCEPTARTGYQALLKRIEELETAMRSGKSFLAPTAESVPPTRMQPEPAAVSTITTADPPVAMAKPALQQAPSAPKTAAAAPQPSEAPVATANVADVEGVPEYTFWSQTLERLAKINISIYAMLRGTKAYFNGKQVLIDVSNPVVLEMLRDNEYTKNSIKQAIFEVTGERHGLGPYRPPKQETPEEDPLQKLIESLGDAQNITIE
ncbi:DNA polymerase III subunit gamma/tau [Oscillospiraceae bacterium LTW-04]|nr:DNA polymerase III subunit gamma/tau [Oscillospiraceae bacterium MB24-C1]